MSSFPPSISKKIRKKKKKIESLLTETYNSPNDEKIALNGPVVLKYFIHPTDNIRIIVMGDEHSNKEHMCSPNKYVHELIDEITELDETVHYFYEIPYKYDQYLKKPNDNPQRNAVLRSFSQIYENHLFDSAKTIAEHVSPDRFHPINIRQELPMNPLFPLFNILPFLTPESLPFVVSELVSEIVFCLFNEIFFPYAYASVPLDSKFSFIPLHTELDRLNKTSPEQYTIVLRFLMDQLYLATSSYTYLKKSCSDYSEYKASTKNIPPTLPTLDEMYSFLIIISIATCAVQDVYCLAYILNRHNECKNNIIHVGSFHVRYCFEELLLRLGFQLVKSIENTDPTAAEFRCMHEIIPFKHFFTAAFESFDIKEENETDKKQKKSHKKYKKK